MEGGTMNNVGRVFAAILVLPFVVSCATSPSKISPAYVSPLQYADYSCDQIRAELQRVNARVMEVAGKQKKQSKNDKVAMGVGLVLFWPALFFLAGGDREEELSRLMGEYDALETVAIQKNCDFSEELEEAREQREAAEAKESKTEVEEAPDEPVSE
jgi:hypothetical protein